MSPTSLPVASFPPLSPATTQRYYSGSNYDFHLLIHVLRLKNRKIVSHSPTSMYIKLEYNKIKKEGKKKNIYISWHCVHNTLHQKSSCPVLRIYLFHFKKVQGVNRIFENLAICRGRTYAYFLTKLS